MFNLQGSELIIILLLALVVLGPEKLPEAMRRAGRAYSDLKKMASGFQQEFNAAMEEPMREVRETADLLRDSADFTQLQDGEREEKPKSAHMGDATDVAPADPDAVPTDDIPFSGPSSAGVASDGFESLPTPGATGAAVAGAAGVGDGDDEVDPVPAEREITPDPFAGKPSSAAATRREHDVDPDGDGAERGDADAEPT